MVGCGSVPLVITSNRMDAGIDNLVGHAAIILESVAKDSNYELKVDASAERESALSALRQHANVVVTVKSLLSLVWNLAHCAEGKAAILQGGGVELLLSTMKQHAADAGVVERACGTLANLSSNDSVVKAAILSG